MPVEATGKGYTPLFVEDTYKGIPLDPVACSVVRDMEREEARKKAGLTHQDVWEKTQRAFEPAILDVKGAPGQISAETKQRLDAIGNAGSLAEAIGLAGEMPEVAALASANKHGFPLFQRVEELQSWQMAGAMVQSGYTRHYASHYRLMAFENEKGGPPELAVQLVRHFAGNADYGSVWVHDTKTAYNAPYSDKWYSLLSAGPKKVQEYFPKLTPGVLRDYLETTLATGKPPVETLK